LTGDLSGKLEDIGVADAAGAIKRLATPLASKTASRKKTQNGFNIRNPASVML